MTTWNRAGGSRVNSFSSKEWCDQAIAVWDEVVFPHFVDPDNYNYSCEYKDTDTGASASRRPSPAGSCTGSPASC